MRQIKFRVWDDYNKELFNIEDFYYFEEQGIHNSSECCLMQFTGILDKNGKEIYEGDILQDINYPFYIEPVFWATTENDYDFDGWLCEHFHPSSKYEIVGNIYENKDLLTIK
jgi:hypothetical protein